MRYADTNAQTIRETGAYGTVEFHAKPASPKPYRTSVAPSDRLVGTAVTAQGASPTREQRARRATIEAQSKQPEKRNAKGGSAQWVELVGFSAITQTYGIKVKVRGISADIYWLPYSKAAMLWYEITGEDFDTVSDTV